MRIRYGNKYRSKSSKCCSGHYHASKLESGYCNSLSLLKKAGEIKDFKTQVPIELRVNDVKVCTHIVDFYVQDNSGEWAVHETKGMELPLWNLKRKIFEALHPDIEYIVIK